jgi:hypothetical protein
MATHGGSMAISISRAIWSGVDGRRLVRPKRLTGKHRATPAAAGGDVIHDGIGRGLMETLGMPGCGSFIACKGRFGSTMSRQIEIDYGQEIRAYQIQALPNGIEVESDKELL